jgi:hypothetical protein
VSLELDPATADSDFPTILYMKDQANDAVSFFSAAGDLRLTSIALQDYSHEGKKPASLTARVSSHNLFFACYRLRVRFQEVAGGYHFEDHVRRECQILQGESRCCLRVPR